MSYNCRNSTSFQIGNFKTDRTLRHTSGSRINFFMTSPETLNTKVIINILSFLLVTHMASSDAWFDSYGLSKIGHSAERFWTDWICEWISQV
jgi:hypothetical protein